MVRARPGTSETGLLVRTEMSVPSPPLSPPVTRLSPARPLRPPTTEMTTVVQETVPAALSGVTEGGDHTAVLVRRNKTSRILKHHK